MPRLNISRIFLKSDYGPTNKSDYGNNKRQATVPPYRTLPDFQKIIINLQGIHIIMTFEKITWRSSLVIGLSLQESY